MVDNSGVSILFSNHVSFDDGEPVEEIIGLILTTFGGLCVLIR